MSVLVCFSTAAMLPYRLAPTAPSLLFFRGRHWAIISCRGVSLPRTPSPGFHLLLPGPELQADAAVLQPSLLLLLAGREHAGRIAFQGYLQGGCHWDCCGRDIRSLLATLVPQWTRHHVAGGASLVSV